MRVRGLLAVLLGLALAGGVTASAGAGGRASSEERSELTRFFTDAEIARSKRYRAPRYALGFASLGVGFLALGAAGLGRGARVLGTWADRASGGRWWVSALLLIVAVTLGLAAVRLPFGLAAFFHDRRFGLATQPVAGYLADTAKGLAVRLAVGAGAAVGLLAVARALPRAWPAAAAGGAALLTVALVFVWPLVYEPLFNRFTPVEEPLRGRVFALADRANVEVGEVLEADASRRTSRQNAYVSGFGATKRVVLYDTLVSGSTPEEIDLVVAHELAHEAAADVSKGTALAAAGAVALVAVLWVVTSSATVRAWAGISGPGDPRVVPLLALTIAAATFVSAPAQNAYSRFVEARADRAALALTRDPDTAVRVEVNLARANVSDLDPPGFIRWAFFTHPPVLERIRIALDWKGANPEADPAAMRD